MRIYIAYKYTNVQDKDCLKKNLHLIADTLSKKGHETFILGRDKQHWKSINFPVWKTIPTICQNILKSDKLLAFLTCGEKSHGLTFELLFAKIIQKEIIVVIHRGDFVCDFEKRFADKVIAIDKMNELDQKLAHEL